MSGTRPPRQLAIEREYTPDMGRQVKALLALLTRAPSPSAPARRSAA